MIVVLVPANGPFSSASGNCNTDPDVSVFIDQYIGSLRRYRGISMDVGDQDGLRVDTAVLRDVLNKYGIANNFEIYPGTHTSKVADRFQNHVLPFFSQNLCFQPSCQ